VEGRTMNSIQILIMLLCGTIGGFIGSLIVAKISVISIITGMKGDKKNVQKSKILH
jgi:hypothetical protein